MKSENSIPVMNCSFKNQTFCKKSHKQVDSSPNKRFIVRSSLRQKKFRTLIKSYSLKDQRQVTLSKVTVFCNEHLRFKDILLKSWHVIKTTNKN